MTRKPGDITVTLRPEPRGRDHLGRDACYRLKRWLKTALRSYGLRCIDLAVFADPPTTNRQEGDVDER